ncbi:MarR family protein [compost metagenome]
MKKDNLINEIRVEASQLNFNQPLGRFLIILFRQFEDELISELKMLGHETISASDLNVIRHVDPQGISSNRIAQLAGVTKQAIGKQIDKLEKDGIVKRMNHPDDQRVKLIIFTKKGQKLVLDSIVIIGKIENRYARILGGKNELENIKRSLQSLL